MDPFTRRVTAWAPITAVLMLTTTAPWWLILTTSLALPTYAAFVLDEQHRWR